MPPEDSRPAPGQRMPLDTTRLRSTIRKGGPPPPGGGDDAGGGGGSGGGGDDETWVYPSEQQFFNACVRKGKAQDVLEEDVRMLVTLHNGMNERTWREVLEYERLHRGECAEPTLLRFRARPKELTPKARLWTLFGGDAPFDRHDWTVGRCGREVRYVIDYYYRAAEVGVGQVRRGFFESAAIQVDVRPALDSPGAALDRLRVLVARLFTVHIAS